MRFEIPEWVKTAALQRIALFEGIQSSASLRNRYDGVIGEYLAQIAVGVEYPEIDVRTTSPSGKVMTYYFGPDGSRVEMSQNNGKADFKHYGQSFEVKTANYLNRAELRKLPRWTNVIRVGSLQYGSKDVMAATWVTAEIGILTVGEILDNESLRWFNDNRMSRDTQEIDGIRKQADVRRLPWIGVEEWITQNF